MTNVKKWEFLFTQFLYICGIFFTFVVNNCYISGNIFLHIYVVCFFTLMLSLILTYVTKNFHIYVGSFTFLGDFTFDGLTVIVRLVEPDLKELNYVAADVRIHKE